MLFMTFPRGPWGWFSPPIRETRSTAKASETQLAFISGNFFFGLELRDHRRLCLSPLSRPGARPVPWNTPPAHAGPVGRSEVGRLPAAGPTRPVAGAPGQDRRNPQRLVPKAPGAVRSTKG